MSTVLFDYRSGNPFTTNWKTLILYYYYNSFSFLLMKILVIILVIITPRPGSGNFSILA